MTIENQIKHILMQETAIDQDELLSQVDGDDEEILSVLHDLMKNGKISYNIDWNIDGRGKTYTTGLIEE